VRGTLVRVSVVDVAPATSVNVVPPSVLTACQKAGWLATILRSWCCSKCVCDQVPCHCTVGLGDPDADAANVAVLPAVTVAELGLVVIDGGTCTVSVAGVLVIDPATFMNTA